jgi:four helix bundle protein
MEASLRNYKDLILWEKAHRLTLTVYKDTRTFPNDERFGLTSQMRRASASIAANLAEGCGRRSDGEMGRFIQIAMGSGAELSYHFLLARDLGLLRADVYKSLDSDLESIMRMMSSLSDKIRRQPTEERRLGILTNGPRAKS